MKKIFLMNILFNGMGAHGQELIPTEMPYNKEHITTELNNKNITEPITINNNQQNKPSVDMTKIKNQLYTSLYKEKYPNNFF